MGKIPSVECPFIFWGDSLQEERRLMQLGWPIEDALTFCFSIRREGGLESFVKAQEEKAQKTTLEFAPQIELKDAK